MSIFEKRLLYHLVNYDIPDEPRRRAMALCLSRYGTRIDYDEAFKAEMRGQYGPLPEHDGEYETLVDRERFKQMLQAISGLIDPCSDRVCIYSMNNPALAEEPRAIFLGLSAGEDHPPVDGLYA